ncbi:MAG: hypothetical protein AB7I41_11420 [Candidatus Sericytochromatia bacterium]
MTAVTLEKAWYDHDSNIKLLGYLHDFSGEVTLNNLAIHFVDQEIEIQGTPQLKYEHNQFLFVVDHYAFSDSYLYHIDQAWQDGVSTSFPRAYVYVNLSEQGQLSKSNSCEIQLPVFEFSSKARAAIRSA